MREPEALPAGHPGNRAWLAAARRRAARALRVAVRLSVWLLAGGLWAWTSLAIFYSNLPSPLLRGALSLLFAAGAPLALLFLPHRSRTARWLAAVVALVVLWWAAIPPANDRDWSPDQSLLPRAEFHGDRVTVRNVRNCAYISEREYTPIHEERTYALDALGSLHFVVEPFSTWEGPAHVFLAFGFDDGRAVAISAEVRKEKGEAFSALKGLFKQYEIMYVVGDEQDLIGLRANIRGHRVYMYPIRAGRRDIQRLFRSLLERANRLAERPEFYHTLANTCATNVLRHVNEVLLEQVPWNRKVLLPGFADRLVHRLGLIDTDLPFEEARRRFQINEAARRYAGSPEFSARIREGR